MSLAFSAALSRAGPLTFTFAHGACDLSVLDGCYATVKSKFRLRAFRLPVTMVNKLTDRALADRSASTPRQGDVRPLLSLRRPPAADGQRIRYSTRLSRLRRLTSYSANRCSARRARESTGQSWNPNAFGGHVSTITLGSTTVYLRADRRQHRSQVMRVGRLGTVVRADFQLQRGHGDLQYPNRRIVCGSWSWGGSGSRSRARSRCGSRS